MRAFAAFLVFVPLLVAQDSGQPSSDLPFTESEVRRVLVLAREAALQQQHAEGGMLGGFLPDRLHTLMTGFRAVNDWQDAVALQNGVNKAHKPDVLFAPPHAAPGDYQRIRQAAEQIDSVYDHDTALQRLVSQELADGFVDDAEQSVPFISGAQIRSETYTDIAVFRWKLGQADAANRSFESAVNAALSVKDTFRVNALEGEASALANIAKRRYEAGDVAGATGTFAHLHSMAEEANEPFRADLCRQSARTQLDLGLFDGARADAACIKNAKDRKSIENEIAEKEMEQALPSKAIANATSILNPEDRVARLAELGEAQVEAGNTDYAMRALDEALKVAQHLSAPDHYVAYPLRRIAYTYLEMGERAKGEAVLQRLRSLKESVASSREQYDFLYDLAVGYADFSFFEEAHSYIAEMLQYPNEQACNVVAYEQAQQGEAEEAVAWAQTLKDPGARTSALVGVIEAMLEANEAHTAKTDR